MTTYTCRCLCKQSSVEFEGPVESRAICHCRDCQACGGGPYNSSVFVDGEKIKFSGPTKEYKGTSDAGNPVIRTFCSNCGSRLCSKSPVPFGTYVTIPTGSMPELGGLPVSMEVFTTRRFPGITPFPNAKQFDEMPTK